MSISILKKIKTAFAVIIFFAVASSAFALTQPKNAIYYNKTGWEYLEKADYIKAVISFKKALSQNPNYKTSLIGIGKAYLHTEAFDESVKMFNEVMRIEKNNIDAVNGLGFAMLGLSRFNDALKYFDLAAKLSEENLDAKYGTAYIYFLTDKILWAKRKLDNILRANPYHYQSLLLMADIKCADNRFDEAKSLIEKAIDSKNDFPEAYVKYGEVLFKEYRINENNDYYDEAVEYFKKAIAIRPDFLQANKDLGYLYLAARKYNEAAESFERVLKTYPDNINLIYNLALAYEKKKETDKAILHLTNALRKAPSDSFLCAKLEDLLVLNDYALGHPLRVKLSDEHLDYALKKMKDNLPNYGIINLQRSVLLNPLNKTAHESLSDYYLTLNYYRFYIDELKILQKIYSDNRKYEDGLNIAIIKRRDRLYAREGYANELPVRDVPVILVADFSPTDAMSQHFNAGAVFADYLTFAMSQLGRMQAVSVKKRIEINSALKTGVDSLEDNIEILSDKMNQGAIEKLDYLIYGDFREARDYFSVKFNLLDLSAGIVIGEFSLSESGREYLATLALRASKKIYDYIPFKGRVLKTNENDIIVNLGLFDGIVAGDIIGVYKYDAGSPDEKISIKKKLQFIVNELDTLVCSASPVKVSDMQLVEINDTVYPLKRKRAKRIE